jgi:hypothetical protein
MPLTEEASPIEKALYKIVGAPSAKGAGTDDASSFQFAPKSSYSSDISDQRGGTTDASSGQTPAATPAYNAPATGAQTALTASNTPYDPVAAAAAPRPAATPVATAPVYDLYNQTRYGFASGIPLEVGNTTSGKYIQVSNTNAYDPQITAQLDRTMADQTTTGNPAFAGVTGYIKNLYTPLTSSNPTPIFSAPTRPTGRNVTWQQDQQYWRDLDNYNKQNRLGAYK